MDFQISWLSDIISKLDSICIISWIRNRRESNKTVLEGIGWVDAGYSWISKTEIGETTLYNNRSTYHKYSS